MPLPQRQRVAPNGAKLGRSPRCAALRAVSSTAERIGRSPGLVICCWLLGRWRSVLAGCCVRGQMRAAERRRWPRVTWLTAPRAGTRCGVEESGIICRLANSAREEMPAWAQGFIVAPAQRSGIGLRPSMRGGWDLSPRTGRCIIDGES